MITLQAKSWLRFMRLSQMFSIPVVGYLFWQPNWLLGGLATVLCYCVIVGIGLSGAIFAIASRLGFIELQWDDESKKSMIYKMNRLHGVMNPRAKRTSKNGQNPKDRFER